MGQVGPVQTFSFAGAANTVIATVNQSGVVAGFSNAGGGRPFAFAGSPTDGFIPMQGLGTHSTVALAMNNAGIVVGSSYTTGNGTEQRATIWNARTGNAQVINTLGYSGARGINE